jgi:hypothetical protein
MSSEVFLTHEKPHRDTPFSRAFCHFFAAGAWTTAPLRKDVKPLAQCNSDGCRTSPIPWALLIPAACTATLIGVGGYFGLDAVFNADNANVTGVEEEDKDIMFHLPLAAAATCSIPLAFHFFSGAHNANHNVGQALWATIKALLDLLGVISSFFLVTMVGMPLLLNLISEVAQWAACASVATTMTVLYVTAMSLNPYSQFAKRLSTSSASDSASLAEQGLALSTQAISRPPQAVASFNIVGLLINAGIMAAGLAAIATVTVDPFDALQVIGLCAARCSLISAAITFIPQVSLAANRACCSKRDNLGATPQGGRAAFAHIMLQLFKGVIPPAAICALWHTLSMLSGPYGFPTGNHFIDTPNFAWFCRGISVLFGCLSYRDRGFDTGWVISDQPVARATTNFSTITAATAHQHQHQPPANGNTDEDDDSASATSGDRSDNDPSI